MGNSLGFISEDDDLFDLPEDGFGYNVINFTVDAMDVHFRHQNNHPNNLPVCEKPNVDKFRVSMTLITIISLFTHNNCKSLQNTDMYKEVKARCSFVSKPTEQRWNLMQALQKRENGLAYPGSDSFSPNQQRYFSNMYIPNHRSMRLMSLDAKVFVSKFNKTGSKLLTACQGQFQFQSSSSSLDYQIN